MAKLTDASRAQIIEQYRTGVTIQEIVEAHDVTKRTVYDTLKAAGVPRRRRPGGPRKPFTPDELREIEELRRQGWSKERLLDKFNVGYGRLNRALADLGLTETVRRYDAKERVVSSQGYAYILMAADDPICGPMRGKNAYVMEHRAVMARSLGRSLRPDETVHHINGDRLDNRIENLQIRQGKHGRGVRMMCMDCGGHNVETVALT